MHVTQPADVLLDEGEGVFVVNFNIGRALRNPLDAVGKVCLVEPAIHLILTGLVGSADRAAAC